MSPYRTPFSPSRDQELADGPPRDDLVLAVLLLVIGGLRVTIAIADHEVFETEATVALLMVAFAIGMLVRTCHRRS